MVTLDFLTSIRSITYSVMVTLFGIVLLFFLLSLAYQLLKALVISIRTRARRKALPALIDFMLGQSELTRVTEEWGNRNILIDGFATLISSIRGQKQERMKSAVNAIGLMKVLHRWLRHFSPSRRMRACYLLGLMKSRTSTEELLKTLSDFNPAVVSAAIIALGEIMDNQTIPELVSYFNNCSYAHAWLIAAILPRFGGAIYEHIRPSLFSDELPKEKKVLLLKVIINLRIGESLRDLRDLYERSSDLDIRVNALKAVGSINDLSAVKLVFDALTDEAWEIRAAACNTLGEMSLKGAAYRLIPLLKDENYYVRKNATRALIGLGQIGIMTLVSYLEIDDNYARDAIVQTLEEFAVVDRALEDATCDDPKRRRKSRQLLHAIVQKGYIRYLSNYTDSHPLVQELLSEHAYA
jgi:HEAT repeat protein